MRFIDFKMHFKPFLVFSTQDIKKWDNAFDKRRLVEWQKKGYIIKIINRWYIFNEPLTQEQLLIISNRIYSPSYISLQWAMSYYRFIPEGVYTITAVTSLKPHNFDTPIGTFSYRHVKPSLMFGYRLINFEGMTYRLAEPEKVILDYLYLNPEFSSEEDLKSLRLNTHQLSTLLSKERLEHYLRLFNSMLLRKRVNVLTEKILENA